ncbi:MAG: hypothetical protein ITG07_07995 [Candidimonas sp.]|nr:hypothetical protein [Candidimonas sp.]
MKNMGILNTAWNPIRPGGLTTHEVDYLKGLGWKEATVEQDVSDVPIGFAAPELPGAVTMHNFSVPAGTKVLYNPEDERAIILGCGNPTCWRYLMR